jgi:hypothetical protein
MFLSHAAECGNAMFNILVPEIRIFTGHQILYIFISRHRAQAYWGVVPLSATPNFFTLEQLPSCSSLKMSISLLFRYSFLDHKKIEISQVGHIQSAGLSQEKKSVSSPPERLPPNDIHCPHKRCESFRTRWEILMTQPARVDRKIIASPEAFLATPAVQQNINTATSRQRGRAGLPTTMVSGDTSLVTTLPAPTRLPEPTVMPSRMTLPAPM